MFENRHKSTSDNAHRGDKIADDRLLRACWLIFFGERMVAGFSGVQVCRVVSSESFCFLVKRSKRILFWVQGSAPIS